nr:diguanylate cyclase [Lachnospiraceae bacterium]
MIKNSRLIGVISAGIMWIAYCICLMTGQYVVADILSPLCALFVFSSILSVAVVNVRYRVPILLIAFGPLFWALGDIVYLLKDFGFVADSEVIAISDPIYRVTSYAYVLGMIAFGFVQYSRKDMLRISVNTFLFSITTFIISIATFQMVTHEELTFAKLHPLHALTIMIAMFIIVFFLVIIASRAKRQISFYGLMVLSSFLLYGVLDIRYMMMDAVGLDASNPVVDALFLLSIVMLGFAYSTTSLYKLIYKTEKDTVKRSNAAGNVMAIVALVIGLLLCISGNMPVRRWFIMLIVAMAYFLVTKTIQLNELNEMLIEQKENELSEVTEKLNNVSLLDMQTGLKNRRAWDRYGEDYVLNNSERRLILYSIDANFFKLINNTYGAKTADKVLLEIGRRLLEIEDVGITTYRTDGDQFMVACEDVMGDVNAARFADYLMDVLDRPYEAGDKIIRVSFTI